MNEVAPANAFSAQTGRPVGTYIGLVADGFYGIEDFNEDGTLLADLPVPAFGSVQPGDVKYLDLDRNGVVDQNDVTRIGRSAYPEWYFSFGGRFGYKGFDMQVLFQGVAECPPTFLTTGTRWLLSWTTAMPTMSQRERGRITRPRESTTARTPPTLA